MMDETMNNEGQEVTETPSTEETPATPAADSAEMPAEGEATSTEEATPEMPEQAA